MNRISAISTLVTPLPLLPSCSFVPTRRCYPRRATPYSRRINLKPLTSRIVLLTRRRQLGQIVEEVEAAKKRYGRLNTIVMNSVLEACVHCGNIDLALRMFHEMAEPGGIGVDSISYATILKVILVLSSNFEFWFFPLILNFDFVCQPEFDVESFVLVKGLGKARRIDEAFQMLETIEYGTAAGTPKLSSSLIYGLLDALINAGKILKL